MRKRRLYRHSQRRIQEQQLPPSQGGPSDFDRGIQQGIHLAMMQHGRIVADAHRSALVAAQSEPHMQMARQGGFDQGYAEGIRHAGSGTPSPSPKGAQFTYMDVESARQRGYAEGKAVGGIPNVDAKSVRKKLIDEVLESCRVISESNPSMAPGVNAVRHLVKKL